MLDTPERNGNDVSFDPYYWWADRCGWTFLTRKSVVFARQSDDSKRRDKELLEPWSAAVAVCSMASELYKMKTQGEA